MCPETVQENTHSHTQKETGQSWEHKLHFDNALFQLGRGRGRGTTPESPSLQVSCLSRNKFASAKVETVTVPVPETETEIRSLALWNLQLVFVMDASLESNCQVCALSLLFWLSHDLCLIN